MCCTLTSDQAKHAIPKTAEVVYSIGVGELGWQYGTGLKSHGTVTNWCTGREWPVNWWQLFQLDDDQTCNSKDGGSAYSDGQLWGDIEWSLNYYITQCTGNSRSLETKPVGEKIAVEKTSSQRGWATRPRLSSLGERERNAVMANRVGVNMLQSCSVSNTLSHTNLSNKVRGIFF